jgi:hypothetical protein
MATPRSAPASCLLLLLLLAVGSLAVSRGDDCCGYNVVSVAGSGSALSARLELAGETPALAELGPDVQRLSLTARQV